MFSFLGSSYKSLTKISLVLLYLLILAGGVVRCTGSGMGCPDWPKCYGSWFSPISIDDITQEFNPTEDKVYGSWIEYFNRLIGGILGFLIVINFYKFF